MININRMRHIGALATLCLSVCIFTLPSIAFSQKSKTFKTNGKSFEHTPKKELSSTENKLTCTPEAFRTFDGSCNNTTDPDKALWGSSEIAFERILDAEYGLSDPYNALGGENRRSARDISNLVHRQFGTTESAYGLSSFVFTWGQFLDHDITLTPEDHIEYEPIALPANEQDFSSDIPFFRSAIHTGTGQIDVREQTNIITAWIDASNVYGSDEIRAAWLRTFSNGKLKTSQGNLLPFNTLDGEYDSPIDPDAPSMAGDNGGITKTFVAGDVRAGEQPGLTSLHTLFVREHNRICDELRGQGLSDDEEIYQMARKRVGALMQVITYREFLPALGVQVSQYNGYRSDRKPNLSNLFSAAAYRLGHTMVTDEILLRDNQCQAANAGSISLIDGFFNPEVLQNNDISLLLKGLAMQTQNEVDVMIVDELRNFLFAVPGQGTFGLDLAALNIQRGRDHGLPDFNSIRARYLGQRAQEYRHINSNFPLRLALESASDGDIDNIDAWTGLLAEQQMQGRSIGPTLNALLGSQFSALRDGDRYYFEHDPWLDNATKNQIRTTSLSDVIRSNSAVTNLQENVFFAEDCNQGGGGNGGGNGGGGNGGIGGGNGGGNGGGGNGGGGPRGGGRSDNSSSKTLNINPLYVFPNPANNQIQITATNPKLESASLNLFSLEGKLLISKQFGALGGELNQMLNISTLPSGIYILKIQSEAGVEQQKIVVDRK